MPEENKHVHLKLKKTHLMSIVIATIILIAIIAIFATRNTCNDPYVKIGTSCCLDSNKNGICDTEDVAKSQIQTTLEPIPGIVRLTIPNDVEINSGDSSNVVIKVRNDGTAEEEYFIVTIEQDRSTKTSLVTGLESSKSLKILRGKEDYVAGLIKTADGAVIKVKYNILVTNKGKTYAQGNFYVNVT